MTDTARPTGRLTAEQRRALEVKDASVALGAGAGCGKTTVLTERFLAEIDGRRRPPPPRAGGPDLHRQGGAGAAAADPRPLSRAAGRRSGRRCDGDRCCAPSRRRPSAPSTSSPAGCSGPTPSTSGSTPSSRSSTRRSPRRSATRPCAPRCGGCSPSGTTDLALLACDYGLAPDPRGPRQLAGRPDRRRISIAWAELEPEELVDRWTRVWEDAGAARDAAGPLPPGVGAAATC